VPRPEQQASLGIAWRTAPVNDRDVYAVDLLTYILGDSPSSRLNQAVRERDRLVFSIDSNYSAWERAGLVTVTSRLPNDGLLHVLRANPGTLKSVTAIGDAHAPALIAHAVYAGHRYARELDAADRVDRRELVL